MKNLLIKNPIIYLLFFFFLSGVAGVEIGNIIKNGLPEQKGITYFKIFEIIISIILSFCFLFTFVKIKNKKKK